MIFYAFLFDKQALLCYNKYMAFCRVFLAERDMTTHHSQKQLYGILTRQSVLPVILAKGFAAHRLALRLFLRHGWRSVLCVPRPRLGAWLNPLCIPLSWACPKQPRLCVEQLLTLADSCPDKLPILLPLSPEGQAFVKRFSPELETRFIVSASQRLLSHDTPSR